jgi:hypothetical protein
MVSFVSDTVTFVLFIFSLLSLRAVRLSVRIIIILAQHCCFYAVSCVW